MAEGAVPQINIAPHRSMVIRLDLPELELTDASEYFLDLSVTLKKAQPFRSAGFEVAHEQFLLKGKNDKNSGFSTSGTLALEQENEIRVTGENFVIGFDRSSGSLNSYEINGYQLLQRGPTVNFWRPPNDNDKGSNMISRLGIWREATQKTKISGIKASQLSDNLIEVVAEYEFEHVGANYSISYKIHGDGEIEIESKLDLNGKQLPDLPRFGMRWELPVAFDNLTYFGRGPHENYIDRNRSAFVGKYTSKVADQYFEYVRPQENGYKTEVRWFELRNGNGVGIRVEGDTPLGFSALHNPIEDFDQETHRDFRHTNDIFKRDGVYVTADLKMMGVAGDNSWGARPYPQYSLPAQSYAFRFSLKPAL